MFTSKSDYLRGFPQDSDLSEVWLTRDQFGMTFLDQLGLMDMSVLLELSKGLSKIGAKIFESMWFKLYSPLLLSSINFMNTDLLKSHTGESYQNERRATGAPISLT